MQSRTSNTREQTVTDSCQVVGLNVDFRRMTPVCPSKVNRVGVSQRDDISYRKLPVVRKSSGCVSSCTWTTLSTGRGMCRVLECSMSVGTTKGRTVLKKRQVGASPEGRPLQLPRCEGPRLRAPRLKSCPYRFSNTWSPGKYHRFQTYRIQCHIQSWPLFRASARACRQRRVRWTCGESENSTSTFDYRFRSQLFEEAGLWRSRARSFTFTVSVPRPWGVRYLAMVASDRRAASARRESDGHSRRGTAKKKSMLRNARPTGRTGSA